MPSVEPLDVVAVRAALLEFFDSAARELPWRGPVADPYAIWVSEVMAQQTRIETVVPYFERWMLHFPDVAALADAPLDDVLRLWEGLGYYSRARNLHSAALIVRERHAGAVPDTYTALRSLPGVGEYTAGAISSMAFGERVPAVDGNVRRVLARLLDEPAPTPAQLRETATALLPADRPGDFNQALMELGATICTPRRPRCHRCVIADHCASRAAGTQSSRPLPRKRSAVPTFDIATAVLRRSDGRVLIARRAPTGLLAGLWNFPGRETGGDENPEAIVEDIAAEFGAVLSAAMALCTVEHVFSHRRERYHCMMVDIEPHDDDARSAGDARTASGAPGDVAWVGPDAREFALPRAQRRIHTAVFAHDAG
jgi:A/G-specific adenine glycosylase